MSWLQIALAALSLINLAFVLAAAYLLNEILRSSEAAKTELVRAARQSTEGAHSLLVAARRSVAEMERVHQAHLAHENSSGRAIHELSRQMKILSDAVAAHNNRAVAATVADSAEYERLAEDARAKLRSDLNVALSKSHQLQDELEQTQYRMTALAHSHQDMQQELRDTQDVRKEQVNHLLARMAELENDLEEARKRAQAAELHAEENARLLDDIREQAHAQWLNASAQDVPQIDQSGLIQSQQDQIDALAAREAKLMQQLSDMDALLQRNLTEKEFIEERFLQLTPKM